MIYNEIRILVDGRWYDSFYSGVTTYIKGIYNRLSEFEGVKVYVVSENEEIFRQNFSSKIFHIKRKNTSNLLWLNVTIPNIIKEYKIDYAHFQYITPFKKYCKYITTLHDLLFLDFKDYFPLSYRLKKKILFKYSANRTDILLTVSNYSKDKIAEHFGIDSKKIFVTPNGVERLKVNRTDSRESYASPYILYVSRIEPRKNHHKLIEAYVQLELYKRYELIFIGKSSIDSLFSESIKQIDSHIRSKIIHLQNVSEDELIRFYRNCDLFVFPSIAEGFGIPPLEAVIYGAKVICSNSTAMADFKFFEEYQFSPNDIEELKAMMMRTINEDDYPFSRIQNEIMSFYKWDNSANILHSQLKKYKEK